MFRLHPQFYFIIFVMLIITSPAYAKKKYVECKLAEKTCILNELSHSIENIDEDRWRDIAYRELAKSLTLNNQIDAAIKVVDKIKNSDTKALTIRGIGMNSAQLALSNREYKNIFSILREKAEEITHPPSYSIALTYIAMAQSYSNMDDDAIKTAFEMKNASLKHKALGEIAEIQAANNKNKKAIKTVEMIESTSYQNKAYRTITKIMAENGYYQDALVAAKKITNPVSKSDSLQIIINLMEVQEKKKNIK